MTRLRFLLFILVTVLGLAAGTGCRESRPGTELVAPIAPENRAFVSEESGAPGTAASEFYPLSVGSAWVYRRDRTLVVEVIVGPPYKRVERFAGTVDRRIEGTERIDGAEYFVEGTTLTPDGRPAGRKTITLLRQDHSGLYSYEAPIGGVEGAAPGAQAGAAGEASAIAALEAGRPDVPSVRPVMRYALRRHARKLEAVRASLGLDDLDDRAPFEAQGRPGDFRAGESRALRYPLHARAGWYNRVDPFVVRSFVEAHESLELPAGRFPAWRVRVENELLDPEDRVVVWYGRSGRLAVSIHTETLALDSETGETALITVDELDVLTDISLERLP
jgi:hypothetical protein